MTKVNILPLINYPNKLYPFVKVDFEKKLYDKYGDYCRRFRNDLYIYGEKVQEFKPSQYREISLGEDEEGALFSLLLQRLTLHSIVGSINSSKFFLPDNFISSRIYIQRKNPSIKTKTVHVHEEIEIQTIHWQDINYGLILNYSTRNKWAPSVQDRIEGKIPCSYKNIKKYLGKDKAEELIKTKIPNLRGEIKSKKWRGDALKQKFKKVKEVFKESMDWKQGNTKEFQLPIEEKIEISNEFTEVVPLG